MRGLNAAWIGILSAWTILLSEQAWSEWQAGVARVEITPRTAVWLSGWSQVREPEGTLHALWMKALALKDPHEQWAILITSDFMGVPRSMSDVVFARLHERYGLSRAQVMFTFSHNHCGPRLGDDVMDYWPRDELQERLVAEYTAEMIDQAVALVGRAMQQVEPVSLAQGSGRAGFAVNRRNNREAEVAEKLQRGEPLVGPVDHRVPVLAVRRRDDTLLAIVFGYACHPTTINLRLWNGDYPGFAQLELEADYPGATAMFVNTCGGDQNPLPRFQLELCQKYAHELATAVHQVLSQPLQPITPALRVAFEEIDLAYEHVVSREELEREVQSGNPIKARWAVRMLQDLEVGKTFSASYRYPVHVWRLGDEMTMIGLGAEAVVDYSLKFQHMFGPGTWVCGYTDDQVAYIPSRRVWEEGGYEGGWRLYEYGRPAYRWAGDVEDRITAAVQRLATQVGLTPLMP
ncbi:MAG: hypothetical protein KatS3mg114_0349 [Planctomycetaceae bacterium]|nr:MAG: hypothetical protein KatS3mg114_0349 [Planctomycetaceae bacterium]